MPQDKPPFEPDPAQMALWPKISGNEINGLGSTLASQPKPIYWHSPESTPHGPLQRWFYAQSAHDPLLAQARAERQQIMEMPLSALSGERLELPAQRWVEDLKQAAGEHGADWVGIAEMRPEWVFDGHTVDERWIIMIGVAHRFEEMEQAPASPAAAEVVRQYARGNKIAKGIASLIRERGHEARPHGGPMAGPVLLIPAALACGFGELGKHGSIINRKLGSSFRLACVLTDVPLIPDGTDCFGADEFCLHCRVCADACPPVAIVHDKQLVRGVEKWYVDFDKCLPFFNESMGCGICIAVCPWSRPGVALNLVEKMARRKLDRD
ncbi:MAG: 4Fe-4S dicluster domain-containing protein [Burkholderiaceae bacterium]|jgi:ferredoxin